MLDKLYSPQEVLNTFPDGHRPSLRRLIAKAKEAGACLKCGRGVAFDKEGVETLKAYLKCSDSRNTGKALTGKFAGQLQGGSYTEVRKLLTERKRKNLDKNSKERHSGM